MSTFGITPAAGFPPQASDEFPNYIQFQQDGTDLGAPNVDTVNFADGLTATRGTGESANVVTVVAQTNPSSGGGGGGGDTFTWVDTAGDYLVDVTDVGNGIRTTHTTGLLTITVPGDASLGIASGDGVSVLIMQAGLGRATVVGQSGVTVNVRSALASETAGQYAVLSLIHTAAEEWVLCGDLRVL